MLCLCIRMLRVVGRMLVVVLRPSLLSITQHKLSFAIYHPPTAKAQRTSDIKTFYTIPILLALNHTQLPAPTSTAFGVYIHGPLCIENGLPHTVHMQCGTQQPSSSSKHISHSHIHVIGEKSFLNGISRYFAVSCGFGMGMACQSLETYQNYCCQRSHSAKLFIEKKMGV